MGQIQYTGLKTKYNAILKQSHTQQGGHAVEVIFTDMVPKVSDKGFTYYGEDGEQLADYSNMTTIYKQDYGVNGYMLSADGTTYVEPTVIIPEPTPEPEPYVPSETELRIAELQQIIADNKSLLAESDYKVIKNSEYAEAGIDVEYEPTEVNAERQAYRDAINAAETELATLTGGADDAS